MNYASNHLWAAAIIIAVVTLLWAAHRFAIVKAAIGVAIAGAAVVFCYLIVVAIVAIFLRGKM